MGRPSEVARGFTLLELIVTLAVLAIAAAVVTPAIGRGTEALQARAEVAGFAATLRHARERAIKVQRTHLVVVDPKGRVARIEVLSFSEPEDYLPRGNWYAQFQGKALDAELRLKGSIRPVTGASLTASATTDAVRRVLALNRVLEHESSGTEPRAPEPRSAAATRRRRTTRVVRTDPFSRCPPTISRHLIPRPPVRATTRRRRPSSAGAARPPMPISTQRSPPSCRASCPTRICRRAPNVIRPPDGRFRLGPSRTAQDAPGVGVVGGASVLPDSASRRARR